MINIHGLETKDVWEIIGFIQTLSPSTEFKFTENGTFYTKNSLFRFWGVGNPYSSGEYTGGLDGPYGSAALAMLFAIPDTNWTEGRPDEVPTWLDELN